MRWRESAASALALWNRASSPKNLRRHWLLCRSSVRISIQSGCDKTLKRMNRHYTTEEYAAGCEILRRYFDNPAITTDVIVGFPGETEEEFEETKAFLERIGFYEMHIFKYSRRAGTRADRMPEQVPEQVQVPVPVQVLSQPVREMSHRRSFCRQALPQDLYQAPI